jgi:hypothetical protein
MDKWPKQKAYNTLKSEQIAIISRIPQVIKFVNACILCHFPEFPEWINVELFKESIKEDIIEVLHHAWKYNEDTINIDYIITDLFHSVYYYHQLEETIENTHFSIIDECGDECNDDIHCEECKERDCLMNVMCHELSAYSRSN